MDTEIRIDGFNKLSPNFRNIECDCSSHENMLISIQLYFKIWVYKTKIPFSWVGEQLYSTPPARHCTCTAGLLAAITAMTLLICMWQGVPFYQTRSLHCTLEDDIAATSGMWHGTHCSYCRPGPHTLRFPAAFKKAAWGHCWLGSQVLGLTF